MEDKLVNRIKKLLTLGLKDPESPEAKLAMEKAGELMAKYGLEVQLDEDGCLDRASIEEQLVEVYSRWTDVWERPLATSIGNAFDCRAITVTSGHRLPTRLFLGEKNDLELAVYFYKFIRMQIMRMAESKYKSAQDRSTYGYGCVCRVDERLKEMYAKKEEAITTDGRELMVVKKDAVDKAFREKFPNTRRSSTRITGSRQAFNEGYSDGDRVKMSRQVGGSANGSLMIGR